MNFFSEFLSEFSQHLTNFLFFQDVSPTSPPSSSYMDDFSLATEDRSLATTEERSIATEEEVSERLSEESDKSDNSVAMFDLNNVSANQQVRNLPDVT